jgi:hypothetical protein
LSAFAVSLARLIEFVTGLVLSIQAFFERLNSTPMLLRSTSSIRELVGVTDEIPNLGIAR